MEVLSIVFQVILGVLLISNLVVTRKSESRIMEMLHEYTGEEMPDSLDEEVFDAGEAQEPSAYEQHLAQRVQNFDTRIEQIKRELSENADLHGHDAEVLHPDVENLPHNDINESNPPDVEYTV